MADVTAARIIIPVETDANVARRQLLLLDDAIEENTQSLGRLDRAVGIATAAFAAIGAVNLGRTLLNAASDAEETANRFNVTFRGLEGASQAVAQAFARDFGLAQTQSQALLANTGDLLTGFGFTRQSALDLSREVNTLAADLASFTNIEGGTERASQALTAALLGETDAARSLGIVIRAADVDARLAAEGLNNLTGEALLQAQAQARLQIAIEQSGNALGDFARSSGSFANQARIFQARLQDIATEIGGELIPGFTRLINVLNESQTVIPFIVNAFRLLARVIGAFADAIATAIQGVEDIAQAFDARNRVQEIRSLEAQINTLNQRVDEGGRFSNTYAREAQRLTARLLQARIETNLFTIATAESSRALQQRQFDSATRELTRYAQAGQLASTAADIQRGFLRDATREIERQNARIAELRGQNEQWQQQLTNINSALNDTSQSSRNAATGAQELTRAVQNSISVLQALTGVDFTALEAGFSEQVNAIERAGLDISLIQSAQQRMREENFRNSFDRIIADESLSFDTRQQQLQSFYATIMQVDGLTNDQRLAAQRAFNQASEALEQQRLERIAESVNQFANIGDQLLNIGQSIATIRGNQIQEEINSLEEQANAFDRETERRVRALMEAGATEAEIDALRAERGAQSQQLQEQIADRSLELRRRQAREEKIFGIFSATINTARAVANALTVQPFPLALVLAGIAAAAGAAQIAAIASTPLPSAQFGGTFVVPPGAEADSGLVRVNQGEEVSVRPVRDSGGSNQPTVLSIDGQQFNTFLENRMERILNSGAITIRRGGVIRTQ